MVKNLIIRILFRLSDSAFPVDYKSINKKALEDWAYDSFDHPGWRSYFAYEDLKILKELARGHGRDSYMILIGRRMQLLHLFDEMRKSFELKKSAEEKRLSAEKKNAKKA
jgi:hypothetical protein